MTDNKLLHIKAGDRVVVRTGSARNESKRVEAVIRVTPTQIVLERDLRFERVTGYPIPRHLRHHLTGKATPRQIQAWEAERQLAADRLKREAELRREKIDLIGKLTDLFPNSMPPLIDETFEDEATATFSVRFGPLTSEQVAALAKKVSRR